MDARTASPSEQRRPRSPGWCLGVAVVATVLTEPLVILWVMQRVLGHEAPAAAFGLHGSPTGIVFSASIRISPFIVFGLVEYLLDRSRIPHEIGFLCAIVASAGTMIFLDWHVFGRLFAGAHFSPPKLLATTLTIPFFAGVIGTIVFLLAIGTDWVRHRWVQ